MESALQLFLRVSHQAQKFPVHLDDGEVPVISVPQNRNRKAVAEHTKVLAQNGWLTLHRFRFGNIPFPVPDSQRAAVPRVLRLQAQNGVPIPCVLSGVPVLNPVAIGNLQRAIGKKALIHPIQPLQRTGLIVWVDTGPHEELFRVLHRFFLLENRKVAIRLIQQMIGSRIPVKFQHRGIQIAQQGKQLILSLCRSLLLIGMRRPNLDLRSVLRWTQAVGIFPGQLKKFRLYIFKAFQKVAGKRAALSLQDHVIRFILWNCFFVHPVGGQRVKTVRHRNHLRIDGNVILPQALGIALAVPAFMVVAADIIGIAQILRLPHPVKTHQNLTAPQGVSLHHLKLLRGQAAGLVQNGVWNGNFTDVVERGGTGNHLNGLGRHPILRVLPRNLPKQNPGKAANAANMLAGFQTAVLNHRGEAVDQRGVGLPNLGGLRFYQVLQMQLVLI
ncbi:hypothetical protein DSECCO2_226090 [anaerobic digester metagenome]